MGTSMRTVRDLPRRLLALPVRAYQVGVSPYTPPARPMIFNASGNRTRMSLSWSFWSTSGCWLPMWKNVFVAPTW